MFYSAYISKLYLHRGIESYMISDSSIVACAEKAAVTIQLALRRVVLTQEGRLSFARR